MHTTDLMLSKLAQLEPMPVKPSTPGQVPASPLPVLPALGPEYDPAWTLLLGGANSLSSGSRFEPHIGSFCITVSQVVLSRKGPGVALQAMV